MQNIREILRLINQGTLSNRQIAKSCHCSPTTIGAIIERYKANNLTWPEISQMDDTELESKLYPQEMNSSKRPLPDYDYIYQELSSHKGVTLQLLWQEYKEKYPDGVQYTQFCDHYLTWRRLRNISMHQIYRAGEKMFTDWAGLTSSIIDRETGEVQPVYFFVAVLGASKMIYTEPFLSMDLFPWNQGHVHAFEYFGGSTEIIVPDNTKTAVKKPCYYEPEIHPSFLEMARYYSAAIIPARVRKPKDKSPVEKEVQDVERWIIAKLRNRNFFSLYEFKQAVKELLEEANNRPFQMVRATANTVEIFHKNKRIASHARGNGKKYSYSTLPDHMPQNHRQVSEWSPERIKNWSKTVGSHTANLVQAIMERKVHPEQAFRACMGIIRLTKSYPKQRVENAAKRALAYGAISYQSVLSILQKNLDLEPFPEQTELQPVYHENLRGPGYYTAEVD